jgi:hypothetical protein
MINSDKASHQSGGVGAGGGVGKESGLSREISSCGTFKPQPTGQTGQTRKPAGAQGEVGVTNSSADAQQKEHCVEPRGGTRTHATKSGEGRGDGWLEGEYLFDQIGTPLKVRKLQLALYRKGKGKTQTQVLEPVWRTLSHGRDRTGHECHRPQWRCRRCGR